MKIARLITVAVLPLMAATAFAASDASNRWESGKGSAREYQLYVPPATRDGPAPLVVMLHGCGQGPDKFAESTRMNEEAEKNRFLVLYPQQRLASNPARCWNWFLPENQGRSGEPAEIVSMVEQVAARHPVDRKRVYVAGLSAGASMSATLAACYPDVFAAAAIHAGTMYKSATSLLGAQKVMLSGKAPEPGELGAEAWSCGGKKRLTVPVMVWRGEGDNIVNPENADLVVRQFLALDELADDGQSNGSLRPAMDSRSSQVRQGHKYTVVTYAAKGRPLIEYYKVDDMGHAWSGGKDELPFSDGKGPDATDLTWRFFRQFSRD